MIDSAMVDGVNYLSSFLHTSQPLGIWSGERGTNLLDTGAPFYETSVLLHENLWPLCARVRPMQYCIEG